MANTDQLTIQSNIKTNTSDMTQYALFLGGTNVVNEVLQCYDPLRTGYGRIFMVKKPVFLDKTIPTKLENFKHILEYGNTGVQGLGDVTVNFNQIQGGYVGKSFEIPSYATDDTNQFTIQIYEFSGSPCREVIHSWINGTTDLLTGLTHYNGCDESLPRLQANQTAEFIYVTTDNTGEKVEYACLLANCFPRGIEQSKIANYDAGEHNIVELNVEFTCTKYESIQINAIGQALIDKYKVLTNSLNFYSGYEAGDTNLGYSTGIHYDVKTGKLVQGVSTEDTKSPVRVI